MTKTKREKNKTREELMSIIEKRIDKHTKPTKDVILWLVENQDTIVKHQFFDYPEYGGMPENISHKLTCEMADIISENWHIITSMDLKNHKKNKYNSSDIIEYYISIFFN